MSIKEIRDMLNIGRKLNREIIQLRIAKEKAFNLACSTVSDIGNEKVQTSSENSTERKFVEYSDYSAALDKRLRELLRYRKSMLDMIYRVNNTTYRTLLIARYINCMSWEKVAETMNYDVSWIHRMHHNALAALKEKCGD